MAQGFSLRFACERPQDRSSPGSSPEQKKIFFFFKFSGAVVVVFSNHSLIGLDSDTCFILELFKEGWECGYNNTNIEENGKDYQRVFNTDSSALC